MYCKIYVDVVFAVNLLMDYLLLRIVAYLFRCGTDRKRIFLAAALGALFSCLILCLPVKNFLPAMWLLHGICAAGMLKFSLRLKKGSLLAKAFISLYLAAFLAGGFWEAVTVNGKTTVPVIFFLAAVTYLGLTAVVCLWDAWDTGRKHIYPVTLFYQGKVHTSRAYYDTGNLLADPLTGAPVSIISEKLLEEVLSGEWKEELKHLKENQGESECTALAGLRPHFLTCRTVGGSELLLAVTLTGLAIQTPKETVQVQNPVFAVAAESSPLANEYQVLLNSRLLNSRYG